MTGRGIDQILARPSDPAIHECYARSALEYVWLAEAASGRLLKLELIPTQMKRFQARLASAADARWLCAVIGRESRFWDVSTELRRAGRIAVHWKE